MRYSRLLVVFLSLFLLGVSCKKDHYDVSNVQSVNAEGEMLLPLASDSLTILDLMKRFDLDSLIQSTDDGDLFLGFHFDFENVVSGDELLRLNDMSYDEHHEFENPYPNSTPPYSDTLLHYSKTMQFDAEHICVFEAEVKSGHLDFSVRSNVGDLRHVVVTSPEIYDAMGNMFRYETSVSDNTFGFDIDQLYFVTDTANKLTFNYDFICSMPGTSDPLLQVDVHMDGYNLAFREIRGFVDSFITRYRVDTTFSFFSDNLFGTFELNDFRLRLSERNTFGLGARLVVDTALFYGDGAPYSMINPLPITIDLPSQTTFGEVYNQMVSGRFNPNGGRILASSAVVINPEGMMEMVTVNDASTMDAGVDVEFPLAFKIDNAGYADTLEMDFSEIEMPELIEKLTLELTFKSTLPFNLEGQFYLYDSLTEQITGTLLDGTQLIKASFDGAPELTTVGIEITDQLLQEAMHSDHVILRFVVDTGGREVVLNTKQGLQLFAKTRIQYNGEINLEDE